MSILAHALRALLVMLKSFSNEVHISRDAEKILVSMSPRIAGACLILATWYSMRMSWKQWKVRLKTVSNEGHFSLVPEHFVERSAPSIAVG
jgi:hypothetical protein